MHIYLPVEPTKAPENVKLVCAMEKRIILSWEPIPCSDQNGEILYYVVKYVFVQQNIIPEVVREHVFRTDGNILSLMITDLQSNTDYNVTIAGANSAGIGIFSSPIVATTRGGRQHMNPCCELFTWHDRSILLISLSGSCHAQVVQVHLQQHNHSMDTSTRRKRCPPWSYLWVFLYSSIQEGHHLSANNVTHKLDAL